MPLPPRHVVLSRRRIEHRGHDDVRDAEHALGERLLQRVVVATVDGADLPALGREPRGDPARDGVAAAAVVDHHDRQRIEAERRRELERLVVGALVELRVADQDHHPRADALRAQAERRTDGQGQPVPERARRDLHAGHEVAVGVVAER